MPMEASESPMINDFDPNNFLASLFGTAKAVLLSPRPFYEGMKTQGGFRNPLMFLVCCVVVHSLLAGLVLQNPGLIAYNILFGIVQPFLTSAFLFLFITQFFKGSGTYEAAFRVNAYAGAVSLFSWIPSIGAVLGFSGIVLVGRLLMLYQVYLIVVGVSCTFSTKAFRALLAVLMTIFMYMLLSGAIHHITGGRWPGAPS
ncbi:MAG: YIP1 family protein [Thermodesulfobacteriota bacterium]|nr:YIP1 family protein [Thermodesulfobacteriota bacterium]